VLALLTKETAVIFPALFLVLTWAGSQERRRTHLWPIGASVGLVVAYLMLRREVLGSFSPAISHLSRAEAILTIPAASVFYLKHLLLPVNLILFPSPDLVQPIYSQSFRVSVVVLLTIALGLMGWTRHSDDRRPLLIGLCWLIMPILPALDLTILN